MHVTQIDTAASMPPGFQATLGELIEAVGRPGFGERLFRTARAATGCTQMVVFAGANGEAPQTVIEKGLGTVPYHLNEKYVRTYWRVDPIRQVETAPQGAGAALALVDAHDLSDYSYRNDCFLGASLRSRATTCRTRAGHAIRFNLYFDDRRAFDPAVSAYLSGTAELIDVLLRRHGVPGSRHAPRLATDDIQQRLGAVAPELTPRELQVCTHIARGLTSEGISLELGISINTVLTYRKRAYGRLGITTQNELLHLLVS